MNFDLPSQKEVIKNDFMQAENWDELYCKLREFKGDLENSSGEKYTLDSIIEIIEKVKKGELGLNAVPRTNDLRLAIKKILEIGEK